MYSFANYILSPAPNEWRRQIEWQECQQNLNDPQNLAVLSLSRTNSQKALKVLRSQEDDLEGGRYLLVPPKEVAKRCAARAAERRALDEECKKVYLREILARQLQLLSEKPRSALSSRVFRKVLKRKLRLRSLPPHQRKEAWLLAANASYYAHDESLYGRDYYTQLLQARYTDYFASTIELDLQRTSSLADKDTIDCMRNVLQTYARRNPMLGYCQGLNFITNFVLQNKFTEEQCFWLLSELIEHVLPLDYYTTMIGALVDQKIFTDLLKAHNPAIYEKIEALELNLSVFTINWFVCLFTNTLSIELTQVVWDHLLAEGSIALLKTGLVLLDYCQDDILRAKDFPEVIVLVEEATERLDDVQSFNRALGKLYLNRKLVERAKNIYRNEAEVQRMQEDKTATQKSTQYHNDLRLKQAKQLPCSAQNPICTHWLHTEKQLASSKCPSPWFTFQTEKLVFKRDHFDSLRGSGKNTQQQQQQAQQNQQVQQQLINAEAQKLEKQREQLISISPPTGTLLTAGQLLIGRTGLHICDQQAVPEEPVQRAVIQVTKEEVDQEPAPLNRQASEYINKMRKSRSIQFLDQLLQASAINLNLGHSKTTLIPAGHENAASQLIAGTMTRNNSKQLLHLHAQLSENQLAKGFNFQTTQNQPSADGQTHLQVLLPRNSSEEDDSLARVQEDLDAANQDHRLIRTTSVQYIATLDTQPLISPASLAQKEQQQVSERLSATKHQSINQKNNNIALNFSKGTQNTAKKQ